MAGIGRPLGYVGGRAWWVCLLLASGLHLGLLAGKAAPTPPGKRLTTAVQLRQPASDAATKAPRVRMGRLAPPSAGEASERRRVEAVAAGQPVLTALPALELASLASVADPWLDYLPRPLLSRAPQALAPVMLEWPDVTVDKDQYQAVLALYIDESGLVRDAKLDDGELPAALLEVARQAFLATRFAPGEWGGQTVKSRVLVELSYEQDPATRVAARGVNGAGQR